MASLRRSIGSMLAVGVLVAGCSGDDDDAATPTDVPDPTSTLATATTDVDTSAAPTPPPTPTSTSSPTSATEQPVTTAEPPFDDEVPTGADDPRVAWAIDETSEHFGYPRDEISVASIEPVTWPTTALGCPKTGVTYAQVEVPGYRITLNWADVRIVYHGALDGSLPFRCEFLD